MQMQKIAPRTIHFKEDVQIREIPADVEETRRMSWDPNLQNKDVFITKPTKQRNVIVGITVCGVVLLVAIICTVVGVVFSQKTPKVADQSLTYNAVCTAGSNQCNSSQGLSCPAGFCVCSSPYSWNSNTKTCTLLTYSQACTASNQCNPSLGLTCINQVCLCDSSHSWKSTNNTCVLILNNTLSFGQTCAIGSAQCNGSAQLTCTGNCTCASSSVWNVSSCVCPSGTFWNSSNLCQPFLEYNQTCVMGSNQCDTSNGLSCDNSLCQCDSTRYWSYNSLTCVNRATINGTCLASTNDTCQATLYCTAGICTCPAGTSWMVANSTCA